MKEKISKLLKNKNTPKLLFILGIAGILLIFASSLFPEEKEQPPKAEEFDHTAYREVLETEVLQIVSAISQDPSAVVTVTLESGVVYEYADQTKRNNASDELSTSEESERTYVTVRDSSGAETPLIVTTHLPRVRGVSVICNLRDEQMSEEIKKAVTAALDINSRQIYIGRKTNQ